MVQRGSYLPEGGGLLALSYWPASRPYLPSANHHLLKLMMIMPSKSPHMESPRLFYLRALSSLREAGIHDIWATAPSAALCYRLFPILLLHVYALNTGADGDAFEPSVIQLCDNRRCSTVRRLQPRWS